jgi:hypothetical protein
MTNLEIAICDSVQDAIDKGYSYSEPEYKRARLVKAVVVKDGMESGNSSVDLILVDDSGQKYVALVSSALVKSIPAFTS